MKIVKVNKGAIFIEFAIVVTLLIGIVYGLAQQMTTLLGEFDHYALATELIIGPQERSLAFNTSTSQIEKLSAATSPSLAEFMDTIGNFFKLRAPNESYAAFIILTHINIDPEQGTIIDVDDTTFNDVFLYNFGNGSSCLSAANITLLTGYAQRYAGGKTWHVVEYAQAQGNQPTSPNDDTGRFGSKLYDLDKAGNRVRRYESLFPVLSVVMCSEVKSIGLTKHLLTYHSLIPRRHLN